MSFHSWLQNLRSALEPSRNERRHRRQRSKCIVTPRPRLESLEDRATPAFLAPVDYATGTQPYAVVAADFNNDTVLDLATANYSNNTFSVLLGNVDGTFQPAVTSAAGYAPQSLAVGDFNGDSIADLATADSNAYVSVLLGNGDGTFAGPSSYGVVGSYSASVAVGDFNGDGLMDLGVTSNYYDTYYYTYYSYANVLLGIGDGSFSGPSATFIDYASANSALSADLNGDIYDDFVTFDSYGYVAVLLGSGSGYLQGPTGYFYTGDYSYGVAAGDLDGDGDNDLVAANYYGRSVGVLLGDGLGGFSGPNNYDVGGYPTSIVLGDFTGDGNLDVATSNNSSDQVSVLYGDGAGAFSHPTLSATGSSPWALAAGKFNGDAWLDLATANHGVVNVSVLINDQNWPGPPPPPPPTVSINDVTVTEGNASSVNATFTVTLSSISQSDVTVHYETADGSATAGNDYAAGSGNVIILAGSTSATFVVAVTGDYLAEPTETFAVNLSAPVNAIIGDGQGVGTILDNEPRASINDATVTEGNTGSVNATFTVTLSGTSDADVTVHYDTANGSATAGSDFPAASGNVTIPAGQTSRSFTIAVTGDRLAEPTEIFTVNLSAPVNGGITDGQGICTILDNEPRISIGDVTKKEGNGNGNKTVQFTFTVTLSAAYDQAVTMSYRTVDGTATTGDNDYIAKTSTLTFAPGETSKTITIEVKSDNRSEADEVFYVDLFGNSGNSLFTRSRGVGTILNDDH